MKVQLREPKSVMKLSKLGSFHQTKLSFLRSFLNEFKDWKYKRDLFEAIERAQQLFCCCLLVAFACSAGTAESVHMQQQPYRAMLRCKALQQPSRFF